jgi:intracellular sulfur oxidation DsrE/DsrF family protein
MTQHRIDRRHFVGTMALAALATGGVSLADAADRPADATGPDDWDHSWLKQLNTKHRAFFDTRSYSTEIFGYPSRFRAAMLDGYGARERDIRIVVGLHGTAWAAALDDAHWASLEVGAFASIDDPVTKARSVRNTVRTGAPGQAAGATTLEGAQAMGVIVLVCNNTLRRVSREMAARKEGATAESVYAELRAGILPNVVVVPAMIAAVGLAQERGASYVFAG